MSRDTIETKGLFSWKQRTPYGELQLTSTSSFIIEVKFASPNLEEREQVPRDWSKYPPLIQKADCQLREYFEGKRKCFDLPLKLEGTTFQKKVWKMLAQIPFGKTKTYGQLARELGQSGAARAVGGANKRNKLPIFIPCHRVIGPRGKLVGFAGGMFWKRSLLQHEGMEL